jgi:hypothetical protein
MVVSGNILGARKEIIALGIWHTIGRAVVYNSIFEIIDLNPK